MKIKDFLNKVSIRHFSRSKLSVHQSGIIEIKAGEIGRSMIEMLGVLAVIGGVVCCRHYWL